MLYPDELQAPKLSPWHWQVEVYHIGPGDLEMVGVEGFEPPTSSSQSWRATRLRYTPSPCVQRRPICVVLLRSTQG